IYIGVAMRDFLQTNSHSFVVTVTRPDGSEWFNQTKIASGDNERAYYIFPNRIPPNAQAGTYKVNVSFNGTTGVYFFTVNCPITQNITGTYPGNNGFKTSNTITSTSVIPAGSQMYLQAASRIILSPGFSSQNGSR